MVTGGDKSSLFEGRCWASRHEVVPIIIWLFSLINRTL